MMYHYTPYGWYTSEALAGRVTDIAPPTDSTTTTPGEPRANWDGRAWEVWPYAIEPVPAPPAPVPPTSVSMFQAQVALLNAGHFDAVGSAIASLPSPEREKAQIAWSVASSVDRGDPLVAMLSATLNLDSAALDALFIAAAAL